MSMRNGGTIENCHSSAAITTTGRWVGGIVGWVYYVDGAATGVIRNCSFTGSLSGKGQVGGIAGYIQSTANPTVIEGCFVSGSGCASQAIAGGIAGEAYYVTITDCYTAGTVRSNGQSVGGIIATSGYNALIRCYSSAQTTSNLYSMEDGVIGPLCPSDTWNESTDTYCYYLSDAVLGTIGTYLTDTRMRDLANFTGFSSDVWAEDDQSDPINGGYPYLKANAPGTAR